jgi:radical SAM superfamily enzyme YgiQ (UPF0313 family)
MKFILINPDYMVYGDPPLGLAYLASYLRKKCDFIEVKIFDQMKDNEILARLGEEKPQLIGLTAVSQNYYRVKELAKTIKKLLPESILIIGGVHLTTCPQSFKNSPFDIAVRGEGEIPALKLVTVLHNDKKINIKHLSRIPGLMLRDKKKIIDTGLAEQISNLNDLPFPARNLLNMKYYKLPRFSSGIEPRGSISTSRGCPYSCKFCSSSAFWGRKIRFFSAKRVVDEISLLYEKYGYRFIMIYDDLFSINKNRLREIVDLLDKKKLLGRIFFAAYGRANYFDEETALLLKKMGVVSVAFGFETGSERMLNYLKGGTVKVGDNINAVKISKKNNLRASGFFMIGSPTETIEDIEETYKFIKKILLE